MASKYYTSGLSIIHDKYFIGLAEHAAEEVLRLIPDHPSRAYTLVDLGCGSGVFAAALSQRGVAVTGVDLSEDMLAIARQRAPQATFVCASLFDYDLPPADVVTAIGEPINYLFDEKSGYAGAERLFARIYRALPSGGLLVFDALTTGISKTPSARVIEKADATLFLEIHVDETASVLERRIWFFTRHGDFYAKGMETHRQFLFDPATLGDLLHRTGFHATPIYQYAGLSFRQGHMGFVCRK